MLIMRNTYLLTMVVFCMITMQLSAYHHRPYIISGWPIMIGDDDQVAIPDDAQISKMPEPIQKRFHLGWNILQNRLRNQ
ncbi:Uncharacterized protein BM_BM76 [Brugia malayi]|uniref:Uncharacterized protein n=1 Tax=Brugia malayi TaxID=6279 RepID=A0A4E9EYZ9_BRUMA|nr:Uncharacterized protein BM_BM76 [Brugia malayi]VIO89693.1 Uncharacterized protein BM_BM76 [Brugia malayi]